MTNFIVIVVAVSFCLVRWPEATLGWLTLVGFKAELWVLNLKMKYRAWKAYRALVAVCKDLDLSPPGPFSYVDIWDRDW